MNELEKAAYAYGEAVSRLVSASICDAPKEICEALEKDCSDLLADLSEAAHAFYSDRYDGGEA